MTEKLFTGTLNHNQNKTKTVSISLNVPLKGQTFYIRHRLSLIMTKTVKDKQVFLDQAHMSILFSDSEAKVSRQGRKDADSNDDTTNRFVDQKERPRNRTPLSPRNISNQSKPGGRGDGSEFNVPLPDNGDRLYIGQKGRQRIRTPLSPRNNSNQSRQMERDDTSEFNVPLPDQGDRRSVGPKGQRSKRTPLSPRNISNQSSHVERDDASEFIAPLPEKGTRNMRNRRQLSESRSGSRVQRQCNYQDSEQGEELEGDSSRMETWPYDERGEGLKKRKRLASP